MIKVKDSQGPADSSPYQVLSSFTRDGAVGKAVMLSCTIFSLQIDWNKLMFC